MTALVGGVSAGAPSRPKEAGPGRSVPRPDRTLQRRLVTSTAVTLPVGCVLIVLANNHAAGLQQPDNMQFALFWLGLFAAMMPLVALACAQKVDAVVRTCALAGIGLFGMIPRLMHARPSGSDEFVHLRQAMEAFLSGEVGHTVYMLPISKEFFGLHQAASAIARMTGLPLWPAGLLVVVLAHVLSVLAVYQLIRFVGVPAPGSAVGAVVYTLNPSWMYFNAAFSYESLALPLVLLCLAAAVGAARGADKPRWRSLATAMMCGAALPIIHHLSTIILVLILALLWVSRLVSRMRGKGAGRRAPGRERVWPLVFVWAWLLAWIHIWWRHNYEWLLNYLGPALSEGYAQLRKILAGGGQSSSGQRSLFGNSANPVYEIVSGYLFPFVTLAIFTWAVLALWRRRRNLSSTPWAFAIIGAMFFASMPMLLTAGGAEGAHRSWAYSFIGIAVVCGLAWSLSSPGVADPNAITAHRPGLLGLPARLLGRVARPLSRPPVRVGVAFIVFVVLAFGGAALGVNVSNRWPGSANVGDDARSVSKEGAAVADWLNRHAPVDTPVLADRYVSQQVGSVGRMSALAPSDEFPLWEIYMSAAPIRPEVLKQISDSEVGYIIVDSRMATTRPRMGFWFVRNEPGVNGTDLFPQAALDRFDCLPWLRAVYAAGPLTVYQVDHDALLRTHAGSCGERPA